MTASAPGSAPRRLLVLRHAKAGGSADGIDHHRELTAHGHEEAQRIGAWIAEHIQRVDQVVCSDAQRTRQTCVWVLDALGELAPTPSLDSRLYEADAANALSIINETEPGVGTLLVVGHMPWVQELGLRLIDAGSDQDAVMDMAQDYPTAGLQVFDVPGEWDTLDGRDATLTQFISP
ncbi:MAG: histidine phosphatase family protein [Micrococcus sp.]|nr:histidine phosphatase family protein [Micrococcus sp.]